MQLETQNVNEDHQEVSQFRYLGLLVPYDNDRRKRCLSKNNSREMVLSFPLKNYEIKIYIRTYKIKNTDTTTIIKDRVWYGCETWVE